MCPEAGLPTVDSTDAASRRAEDIGAKMSDGKALSRSLFAAISKGDIDSIRELCGSTIVHVEAGGTFNGIDEVVDHFKTMTSPFPDLDILVERQLESGDTVVTEMRFTGTQTAPMKTPQGVLPPTGRRVDVPGCVLHTVRDGRIIRHTGYYDQLLFLGQLGLLPEPARS
jgi:ketosteroid isomerase-like protein